MTADPLIVIVNDDSAATSGVLEALLIAGGILAGIALAVVVSVHTALWVSERLDSRRHR